MDIESLKVELQNQIDIVKKCCETCKYHIYGKNHRCNHQDHFGDYVQPYTVCDDYEEKPRRGK